MRGSNERAVPVARASRAVGATWACIALLVASPATALSLFEIDSSESWVGVAQSSLIFDFGQGSRFELAFDSQLGALPGVSSPDAAAEAGLRTALGGTLLVDAAPPSCPAGSSCLVVDSRASLLDTAVSGSWLPGPAASPGTPSPADLAVAFSDPGGFSGALALRDFAFQARLATVLLPGPGGAQTLTGGLQLSAARGALEMSLPLGDFTGGLPDDLAFVTAPGGTFEAGPGGRRTLTLDLTASETFSPDQLGFGLPVEIELQLLGRLVAREIPEPAVALLLALGAPLLALARTPSRRIR